MQKLKELPWRTIISIVVLVLFILLVVRNWDSFVESFEVLKNADLAWLAVAFVGMVLTYFAAAGGYMVVTLKKLKFFLTLLAQVAAAFANKLLPSGVGGLGLNVAYLHKNKYTPAEATTVTAVNSLAAFVSFSLLFITALLIGGTSGDITMPNIPPVALATIPLLLLAAFILVYRNKKIHEKIAKFFREMVATVMTYKNQPLRLLGAVVMATLVTLAYLLALYASARSVGVTVSFTEVFLTYVLGAVATAAIPTPGGLGAAEAALYAGFVSFGVPPTQALSAVLAYRFLTYWLPILPGYLSFQYLQSRKLL